MMVWKMIFLFNWVIFWFHVNLPGGNHAVSQLCQVPGQELPLGSWDMDASLEAMFAKLRTLPPPMEVPLHFSRKKKRPTKKPWEKTPGEVFFGSNEKKKKTQLSWMELFLFVVFFSKSGKSWMLFGEGWVDIKSFFVFLGRWAFLWGEVDIEPTFDEFLVGKAIAATVWWKIKN